MSSSYQEEEEDEYETSERLLEELYQKIEHLPYEARLNACRYLAGQLKGRAKDLRKDLIQHPSDVFHAVSYGVGGLYRLLDTCVYYPKFRTSTHLNWYVSSHHIEELFKWSSQGMVWQDASYGQDFVEHLTNAGYRSIPFEEDDWGCLIFRDTDSDKLAARGRILSFLATRGFLE